MDNWEVALTKCFYCGEGNEIIIPKLLTKKVANQIKEMHGKVISKAPCPKCKELMKQGVFFISVKDGETNGETPYRTGKLAVVKDEAVKRIISNQELLDQVISKRVCWIEDSTWKHLGLPE